MYDWIQRFVQTRENRNTALAYTNDLTQFVNFLQKFRHASVPQVQRLSDAREIHFQEYLFFLRELGYTQSTLARKIASVRTFYRFLEHQGEALQTAVAVLGSQPVEKTKPDFLTPDEVEDLLAAPYRHPSRRSYRDQAMLELIYDAGLRASTLLQLNVSDVIADRSVLQLPGKDNRVTLKRQTALSALNAHLDDMEAHADERPRDKTPLFQNHRRQRLTRQGLWTILKFYLPYTRIQRPVTLEMLRHSHKVNKRPS